uniref:Desmoplakin b n=1 Tax=Mastacembelus armatus TaxID=205130 RepID=A0A7N8XU24_9TELE
MENKRQVQHLVNKSKSIVRLKPRNPEEKSSSPVIVKALCDFKQDQKVICKDNEAILKDNSQRSKWDVTGPGGLDMLVPSVCLIVPPPNPLSVSLAKKNEQYYEAILAIWNQLYINVKSLIAWQYCLLDIKHINSLTMTMLAKMRPEDYRQIFKNLENHFEEFKLSCHNSQMFDDEDKRRMETQVSGAQTHYEQLVVQLPTYSQYLKKTLSELHALRLRLEGFESLLSQHVHICFGDDGVKDCGLMITQLETAQRDINSMREEYLRLRERILKELEGINDPDKAEFLRSEIEVINKRLGSLESISSAYLQRYRAQTKLKLLFIAQVEDIVKVHEARLTEKETTSLSTSEVQDYVSTLKSIKAELELKKNVLASMETQLANVSHWNSQVGGPYYRCDMMLSKYTEQVGLLSDRWKRIQGQIDTRLQDLQLYLPQLQHYTQTSTSLTDWIDATRKKQDSLQNTKIETVQALNDHINKQKALNTEIKAKRETVDSVLKDNDSCVRSVKDYETDLASYTSGLETLLNIPIKRTMLKSPTMDLNQEATQLQTRYMELFTLSGDYYKFLGELLKSMEELKIRNTRIDLLEEELRLLRENVQDHSSKNKSLEDALARYQLQLSQSQEQLLSIEEVKRNTAMQCSATKDSLNTTQSQLSDLNDQVGRLNYLLEEEKRKRRLAEERYTHQQEEYELVLRKRQKELETVSWSKLEVEKSVATKDQELEQLRRQLADEAAKAKELQKELSKVRSQCDVEINNIKLSYESQIHVSRTDMQRLAAQRDEDTTELKLQYDRMEADRRNLEEECRRLRMSISQTEEQRKKAEEEAHSQRVVITEEGRRRRELENRMDELMRQREQESSQHKEELAEAMRTLQEKAEKLAYVNHSLEEETRRRKIIEEGQGVLEQSMAQLQVKLTNSSVAATQLGEYEEELKKLRLELERESRERSRLEQNMSSLQGRIKDLQTVRDGLESQVEDLRKGCQEEIARRRQVETELEKSTTTLSEYTSTITTLRQSHEQASTSEKRGEEERLRLQEELEKSLRQNKASAERITQLSAELKALQQQLLQEHARVKEANLRNEGLYRTLEEKTKALNENSAELLRQKEMTETLSKERLKLEEEVRTARHENEELVRSKQGSNDELSSQITALELQLKASERSNVDYRNLVSELSSEREKLKLETEKIQKQASETTAMMQSIQSEYSDIVKERDALLLKLQLSENGKDRLKMLEDELGRIKLSLDSELRNKQRLQEENDRVKRDLSYWKDQYDSKQSLIRQYDTDKEYLEREKNALKSEIERLMRELRELEETYKSRLSTIQKEMHEMTTTRIITETELRRTRESSTLDASTLIFDGVRKPVTANQLLDCGVLDKPTFSQLVNGQKTVPEVSVDKKVNLKGTGPIAGVVVGSQGKMSLSEAKKQMLLPDDSANLLLEAQAATGHIIDPRNNQKLTVEEASGPLEKLSFTDAKNQKIMSPDSTDMLLVAQAATGHIIDPRTNQKLTVEEACAKGVVNKEDESKLFAAEAAAVGYKDRNTGNLLSVGQAMNKGLIDKNTALRFLQAQESLGGILDPILSVFLPKDIAKQRNLIDEDLYQALNRCPECYVDPDTQQPTTYISLKRKCKTEPSTGLLLLPEPKMPLTVRGLRGEVSVIDLVDANLLKQSDVDQVNQGRLTRQDIEDRLRSYLRGSTCIAGVYDEANDKVIPIYQAMKDGLLRRGTTLELLEAQAASGFMVDPINNLYLTVSDAYSKNLFGPEFKDSLLAAESAVTGYKTPGTNKIISLFQAMEKGLIEKGHGIRLLQAQIASGGIIDPEHSHRIDVNVAYKRGYFNEAINKILTDEGDETKGFFDPNTDENLTYLQLKKRCITDKKTGLILLPIMNKKKQESTQKNTTRKRRVLIVDPETNREMTVREAYDKKFIDYDTYLELSQQECEWDEITITAPDGSVKFVIIDRKTGRQYDISELLEKKVIDQSVLDKYRSHVITLTEFADIITNKTTHGSFSSSTARPMASSSTSSSSTSRKSETSSASSSVFVSQDLPGSLKHISSVSVNLPSQEPVGAIFDTENVEKISITEALNRGLVDAITAQRLLEAQACTGGIINPANGRRLSIQEASRLGIINDEMATKLKPAQKAYLGFEDVKTKKKMSVAQAMKEMWVPYEAGQRFMEFQFVTGGLYDPEMECRRTLEDALKMGWLDERAALKLQDIKSHAKNLTCPKSKLKISYKEALDNSLVEESTGVRMLQASSVSSRGISSPYNVSSAPGSTTGSRSGSRQGSRRSSVDLSSPSSSLTGHYSYSFTSFSSTR